MAVSTDELLILTKNESGSVAARLPAWVMVVMIV